MKKQINLFYLTILSILFNSCGRITGALKAKMNAGLFTLVAFIMIITILFLQT